jgi:hypothetical protein
VTDGSLASAVDYPRNTHNLHNKIERKDASTCHRDDDSNKFVRAQKG